MKRPGLNVDFLAVKGGARPSAPEIAQTPEPTLPKMVSAGTPSALLTDTLFDPRAAAVRAPKGRISITWRVDAEMHERLRMVAFVYRISIQDLLTVAVTEKLAAAEIAPR